MIIKLKLSKIQKVVKKNLEFTFLLLTIIVTILSVRIYNLNKNVINQNYINLIKFKSARSQNVSINFD